MKSTRLFRRAASCALATLALCFAGSAGAQQYPPQSGPAAFSGLDCSRCAAPGAGYCVVNPIRFEYTCAPAGTFACAGFSGTSYCRLGTTCWDGTCR